MRSGHLPTFFPSYLPTFVLWINRVILSTSKWVSGNASFDRRILAIRGEEIKDSFREAAKARNRKARELFGEYAWLNLPPGSSEGEGQEPEVGSQ